nr:serine/arginine repetitive matrix protein 2-like [Ipomoea batatas]
MRANTWWFWRDVYPSINLRPFQTVGRLSPGDFGMAMKEGRSARRNNPDLRLYGPVADRTNEAAYLGYIPYQVAPSPQIMTMLVRRGSDSQNVSGRDYDEGGEVGNDSYSPSMSGSTFNQIDEVKNVSADVAEDERQARTPTSTEEVSTFGRGKSPRVVLSALFPHFSPHTIEHIASTLPQEGLPEQLTSTLPQESLLAPGEASSSAPLHVDTDPPTAQPKSSRKKVVFLSMVLDKGFVSAPNAPRPPRGKSRRGKEKRHDPEVEEVIPLKSTKPQTGGRPSELQEALRERDTKAATLLDRIRDKVPSMGTIMEWSSEQIGEQIAEDILRLSHTTTDLFCREKEVEPLQKLVTSSGLRIKELEKELATVEREAALAKKAEEEATNRMKDANSLAHFICQDESTTRAFLKVFIHTDLGVKLVWTYGQWAFTSG